MKKIIIGIIFLLTSCATVPQKEEYLTIKVCNEYKEPITKFYIQFMTTYDGETIETTSEDGCIILPLSYYNSYIYVGSENYLGNVFCLTNDTIIYLKPVTKSEPFDTLKEKYLTSYSDYCQ